MWFGPSDTEDGVEALQPPGTCWWLFFSQVSLVCTSVCLARREFRCPRSVIYSYQIRLIDRCGHERLLEGPCAWHAPCWTCGQVTRRIPMMSRALDAVLFALSVALTGAACACSASSRSVGGAAQLDQRVRSPALDAAPALLQPDAACTTQAQPGCFTLRDEGGRGCWVSVADLGYADCGSMNACTEGGAALIGAECYKWSGSEDSPASDWRRVRPVADDLPTTTGPDQVSFYDDEGCFVHGLWGYDRWLNAPSLTRHECQVLDSCAANGGGVSDGRCYKWTQHSEQAQAPWPQALPDSTTPASLMFDRNAVERDVLLAYAEARYVAVTPLIAVDHIPSSEVYSGSASRVLQRFSQGVRFEHVPMDIDGNGTVSSRLTVPDITDAEVRALIESLAQQVDYPDATHTWEEPGLYLIVREPGECSFSFSRASGTVTIAFGCAAC